MWIMELVRDGIRNLVRHKLRSTLTLLGVVFGVAAVITILGIGEGAQRTVLKEISALGLKNIIVDSVKPPEATEPEKTTDYHRYNVLRYGVTRKDMEQIRTACAGSTVVAGHLIKQKVYFCGKRLNCECLGVPPDYFHLFRTRLIKGRLLTEIDEMNAHRVAVVSEAVAATLKACGGALKQVIMIRGNYLHIVGIVRIAASGTDSLVFMPYSTAKRTFGITSYKTEAGKTEYTRTEIGRLIIHAHNESIVPATAKVVRHTLEQNHKNADFSITVPLDILRSRQRTQRVLNLVLVSIAAISLVIGGIGIMNIMLAIVTERIPEIGVRRAIGARQSDIVLQFLAETVTLSSLGGIMGCVLGAIAAPMASRWTGWPAVITPFAIILALGVSWVVGLVFGLTPAVRAARMDPVTALRYE